jgi:hypothetical protein
VSFESSTEVRQRSVAFSLSYESFEEGISKKRASDHCSFRSFFSSFSLLSSLFSSLFFSSHIFSSPCAPWKYFFVMPSKAGSIASLAREVPEEREEMRHLNERKEEKKRGKNKGVEKKNQTFLLISSVSVVFFSSQSLRFLQKSRKRKRENQRVLFFTRVSGCVCICHKGSRERQNPIPRKLQSA